MGVTAAGVEQRNGILKIASHELWKTRREPAGYSKMSGWSLWIDLGDFAEALRTREVCTPIVQARRRACPRQAGNAFHQRTGSQSAHPTDDQPPILTPTCRRDRNLPPLFANIREMRGYLAHEAPANRAARRRCLSFGALSFLA